MSEVRTFDEMGNMVTSGSFIEKSLHGQKIEPVTIEEFTESLEYILERDFGERWDYTLYPVMEDGWCNIRLTVPCVETPSMRALEGGAEACVHCNKDTSIGSGRFVNRIPVFGDDGDSWLCYECDQQIELEAKND